MSTVPQEERTRAQALAEILGEPDIEKVDWRSLMRDGVVIDLDIGRWRAQAKLELGDLGLRVEDERTRLAFAKVLHPGKKFLLPENYIRALDTIEGSGRKLLVRYSFRTAWGYFVPYTSYALWREENQEVQERYFALRDEIVGNYETIVSQVLQDYQVTARYAFGVLQKLSPRALEDEGYVSEADFVERFCAGIRAAIPAPDYIRCSFHYEASRTLIVFPALVDSAERAGDQGAEEIKVMRLEFDRKRAEAQRRRFLRDQMNRDLQREVLVRKREVIDTFLSDLVLHIRSLVYDVVTDVLDSVNKHGSLHSSSVKQLKSLVEQVSLLNFYNDKDVTAMVEQIHGVLERPAEQRDVQEIWQRLRAIALVTRSTLLSLDEMPRSARAFDVPDVPSLLDVRQARAALNLGEVDLDLPLAQRSGRAGEDSTLWAGAAFLMERTQR